MGTTVPRSQPTRHGLSGPKSTAEAVCGARQRQAGCTGRAASSPRERGEWILCVGEFYKALPKSAVTSRPQGPLRLGAGFSLCPRGQAAERELRKCQVLICLTLCLVHAGLHRRGDRLRLPGEDGVLDRRCRTDDQPGQPGARGRARDHHQLR